MQWGHELFPVRVVGKLTRPLKFSRNQEWVEMSEYCKVRRSGMGKYMTVQSYAGQGDAEEEESGKGGGENQDST